MQEFIKTLPSDIRVEFVAAHGHTVFHQPDEHLTFQLGDGETIASYLGCSFVTNFRSVHGVGLGQQSYIDLGQYTAGGLARRATLA